MKRRTRDIDDDDDSDAKRLRFLRPFTDRTYGVVEVFWARHRQRWVAPGICSITDNRNIRPQ
jgi:hypothetical protein